ncbi:MAG: caspase family protein, partial [Deltaproteobacteria bacterium]|nr:caspase family protein [Deltaproteobacteria bacterium]
AAPFTHPLLPAAVTPKTATIANVKRAVRDWKGFGDLDENNLLLFFFCGHGVARGLDGLTLLMADYGETDDMPMEGAIDFAAMHRGMAQCKASEQCYFIDACRKVSDIATRTTATGDSVIQDNQNRPYVSDWNYAIFYSTLGGEAAYGRKDKPSYYTEELIKGLNGTGSNNRNGEGKWRVSTGDLNIAIHRGLSLRGDKIKIPMSALVQFEFHELKKDPVIPVTVYCDPRTDNELATLSCSRGGRKIQSREPKPEDWEVDIPYGLYDFIAEIDNRRGQRQDEPILPPYREIEIEVAS